MREPFEYIRNYYNVPAEYGRVVEPDGRRGVIAEDQGQYVGILFDDMNPGEIFTAHPTWKMKYLGIGTVRERKLTRSQKRYRDYLNSLWCDAGYSFASYLGIKKKEK